jgi:hypothetical protein
LISALKRLEIAMGTFVHGTPLLLKDLPKIGRVLLRAAVEVGKVVRLGQTMPDVKMWDAREVE